jgi:hypothetical protein
MKNNNEVKRPTLVHTKPVDIDDFCKAADKHHAAAMKGQTDVDLTSGLSHLDSAWEQHNDRSGTASVSPIEAGSSYDGSELHGSEKGEFYGQSSGDHNSRMRNPSPLDSQGSAGPNKLSTPDGSVGMGRHWAGPKWNDHQGTGHDGQDNPSPGRSPARSRTKPNSEDSAGQGGDKLLTPDGSKSVGRHWNE